MEPDGLVRCPQEASTGQKLQLGPDESVYIITPYFLKIHLNIFLSSTSGFPKWFLSFGFPAKILYAFLIVHHNVPHPVHHP